jgi:hypothetical protein
MAEWFEEEFPTPSMEQVHHSIPKQFEPLMKALDLDPTKLKCIIDATELYAQTPTCPRAQRNLWSSYKHHSTIKILGDITPQGAWNFVSDAYGGRITDVKLTECSGWLKTLEDYSITLCDRGFICQHLADDTSKCSAVGAKLEHPTKRQKKEEIFTASQGQRTSNIARARIHVERAFARVKQFHFFDKAIKLTQMDLIGKIFKVCCMLTHYSLPIVSDKRKGKQRNRKRKAAEAADASGN